MTPLIILGGGGHAAVVAETARLSGYEIIGHIGPEPSAREILGPHLGQDADVLGDNMRWSDAQVGLGLGFVDFASRQHFKAVMTKIETSLRPFATIVHPTATVFGSATLEKGVFVAAQAVVGASTRVGACSIVNTGAIVDHDGLIGFGCHMGVGARLCGSVSVGAYSLIGAGAVIRQDLSIGSHTIIGAGSVVVTDVPEDTITIGTAAKSSDASGGIHG